jgi:hypothetical protein
MVVTFALLICLALLSGLGVILIGFAAWRLLCDYGCLLSRPQPPVGQTEWSLLQEGQLPAARPADVARLKQRLSQGCEVHTLTERCTVTSLSDVGIEKGFSVVLISDKQ